MDDLVHACVEEAKGKRISFTSFGIHQLLICIIMRNETIEICESDESVVVLALCPACKQCKLASIIGWGPSYLV